MKYYLTTWNFIGTPHYYLITDTNQCTGEFSDLKIIEHLPLDRIWAPSEDLVNGKVTLKTFKTTPDLILLATFNQHPTIEFIKANHPELLL